jgi:hypothetical protein
MKNSILSQALAKCLLKSQKPFLERVYDSFIAELNLRKHPQVGSY